MTINAVTGVVAWVNLGRPDEPYTITMQSENPLGTLSKLAFVIACSAADETPLTQAAWSFLRFVSLSPI
jgi:hypothetical protein